MNIGLLVIKLVDPLVKRKWVVNSSGSSATSHVAHDWGFAVKQVSHVLKYALQRASQMSSRLLMRKPMTALAVKEGVT